MQKTNAQYLTWEEIEALKQPTSLVSVLYLRVCSEGFSRDFCCLMGPYKSWTERAPHRHWNPSFLILYGFGSRSPHTKVRCRPPWSVPSWIAIHQKADFTIIFLRWSGYTNTRKWRLIYFIQSARLVLSHRALGFEEVDFCTVSNTTSINDSQ